MLANIKIFFNIKEIDQTTECSMDKLESMEMCKLTGFEVFFVQTLVHFFINLEIKTRSITLQT